MEQTSMPNPTTGIALAPRPHQADHLAHRSVDAYQHSSSDDGVPDVQLVDLRDSGDRLDVVVVQPVSGGNAHTHFRPGFGGVDDPGQLLVAGSALSVAV